MYRDLLTYASDRFRWGKNAVDSPTIRATNALAALDEAVGIAECLHMYGPVEYRTDAYILARDARLSRDYLARYIEAQLNAEHTDY
jgi:hypothetical protein